jgi:hypothetical protein
MRKDGKVFCDSCMYVWQDVPATHEVNLWGKGWNGEVADLCDTHTNKVRDNAVAYDRTRVTPIVQDQVDVMRSAPVTVSLVKYPVQWTAEIFDLKTDKTIGLQVVWARNLREAFTALPDLDSGMDHDDTTLRLKENI